MNSKVVIVTGAAQGIGYHLIHHLISSEHLVVAVDNHEAALNSLYTRHQLNDEALLCIHADVSRETDVSEALKSSIQRFGKIDTLINNAAVSANKPPELLSIVEWQHVLNVNLTAPFLLSKLAAPHLRESRGSIINMASTRALMSEPNTEAYSATKGGIVALTHAMAMSLGPDIRVNCISPGWIDVSHLKHPIAENPVPRDWSDRDRLQHPCGRVGKPEDIAACIDFLMSEKAGFITGQNFIIDGGMTRKMIYE